MSKRTTRSTSRRTAPVLSEIHNQLNTIPEEGVVDQPNPSPVASLTGPEIPNSNTAAPSVIPVPVLLMKAIYIAIPDTNVTDPLPDSLVRNDLKAVEFKPSEHPFIAKFLYDTATHKSIPIRVGELTGLTGLYVLPASNVFNDSAATEAVVSGVVWESIARGRNSDVKLLAYRVTGFSVENLLKNYQTRLLASIEDLSPRFEKLRNDKKPLVGYNSAVAVSQFPIPVSHSFLFVFQIHQVLHSDI